MQKKYQKKTQFLKNRFILNLVMEILVLDKQRIYIYMNVDLLINRSSG